MSISYLKGLNSLRFFAAFFVIIAHGEESLWKLGLVGEPTQAIFNRGGDGVEFFFTLSGFLITCLLLNEGEATGKINLKKFYLRRVFRIWPLYFLIVGIGFIFLGLIYPKIAHEQFFKFKIWEGLLMFLLFVPNIATSFYPTGLMYPLWSIGVEEQYYLFWAPAMKLFRNNLLVFILVFLFISLTFYYLGYNNYFNVSEGWVKFFKSLKFYAMAVGGIFAYVYMKKRDWFESSIYSSKWFQWVVLIFVIYHFAVGFSFSWKLWFHFLLSVLFGLIIINTISSRAVVNLEIQPFVYLGIISYGLYMYHMLIDYALRFLCTAVFTSTFNKWYFAPLIYQICLFGLTIFIASLSYRYLESYFLRLKSKLSQA